MKVLGIIFEDTINYRMTSATILMPYCSFKCNKECGRTVCHNTELQKQGMVDLSTEEFVKNYYKKNPFTTAIVFQGLEPFDSWAELSTFIHELRVVYNITDPLVIYTGYTEQECIDMGHISFLQHLPNIIVKFGRFIPGDEKHYDEVLGVNLASDNQYGKRISE